MAAKSNKNTKDAKRRTFDFIRKHYGADLSDNATKILKQAIKVMVFLRAGAEKA